jgi:hypothetical protein
MELIMNKADVAFGAFMGCVATLIILVVASSFIPTNFEKCSERYKSAEEQTECMWLLENN